VAQEQGHPAAESTIGRWRRRRREAAVAGDGAVAVVPPPAAHGAAAPPVAGVAPDAADAAPDANAAASLAAAAPPGSMRGLWRTEIALRVSDLGARLALARAAAPAPAAEDAAGREDAGRRGLWRGRRRPDVGFLTLARVAGAVGGVGFASPATSAPDAAKPPAAAAVPPLAAPVRAQHAAATQRALEDAVATITARHGLWRRVREWASGEAITAAWESVHQAERELAAIETDAEALAALPQLRSWMRQVMSDRDLLSSYETTFDDAVRAHRAPARSTLRQAYQDAITSNVDWHASLRAFRNTLFGLGGLLALLLVGLGVWHVLNASVVPLCSSDSRPICFGTHGTTSPARVIFEIELVGMVGGLLGTAFLLGRMEQAPSRYNLLAPQIVLKAVGGAATALIGVLLVESELIVAPAGGRSTAVLLAYAALFGFSQQLLTQFVDRRASDLLSAGGATSR